MKGFSTAMRPLDVLLRGLTLAMRTADAALRNLKTTMKDNNLIKDALFFHPLVCAQVAINGHVSAAVSNE